MHKTLALAFALAASVALAQDQPQTNLPRVKLAAGMHQIDAQVASTTEQRMTGLMHRKEMPQHEGMLFVFEYPSQQCFWMKNTLLPLSIAFVADDGRIVNIDEMALLHRAGALRARDEQGLVRQEGHQGGAEAERRTFQRR
jgi:uncharacterized protein